MQEARSHLCRSLTLAKFTRDACTLSMPSCHVSHLNCGAVRRLRGGCGAIRNMLDLFAYDVDSCCNMM